MTRHCCAALALFVVATATLVAAPAAEAWVIFSDDWETGYWNALDHKRASGGSDSRGVPWAISQMQTNSGGLAVSTLENGASPRKGNYAMRFTWFRDSFHPSDSNNRRKAHLFSDWEYRRNTDRWYGFSMYLPSATNGMADDSEWELLVQWQGRRNVGANEMSRVPPAAILHKDNRLVFKWYYDTQWISTPGSQILGGQVELGPADKDVWIDFLVRIKWDPNGTGKIEVNRKNVGQGGWVRYLQRNNARIGYNDESDPQLGIGIYKYDAEKRYNEAGNTSTGSDYYRRQIYFDEVTIATTVNEAKP
ncbi:MAG: heparin lyase I family protein [Planctomycetota bacterium]